MRNEITKNVEIGLVDNFFIDTCSVQKGSLPIKFLIALLIIQYLYFYTAKTFANRVE